MQCFGNTGIYPAIFQIQNEEISLNFLATFFCFFRSPARFKDKEKKSRSDFPSLRDFYLLDLGYSALYLADVAVY